MKIVITITFAYHQILLKMFVLTICITVQILLYRFERKESCLIRKGTKLRRVFCFLCCLV